MFTNKDFSKFYLEQINGTYSGLNLTRITDPEEFYEKQIVDSVIPFELHPDLLRKIEKLGYFVDVGFGGGFPILPVRNIINDEIKFLGIDSRRKKVDAVREISKLYNQKNISFFHGRSESVDLDIPCFISLKAVGEINKMLKLINCAEGSFVMFYKAKNLEELEPNFKNNKGYKFIEIKKFNVGNNVRSIVVFEKLKTNVKDNSLVKLSEFVFN
jgi:16S rRNA (guanine527-N7)-methyltransferase